MVRAPALAACAALFVFAALSACAAPKDSADPGGDSAAPLCGGASVDVYTPGVEKLGDQGALSFAITQADPAPPDKGDNTWVVLLTDAGAPADGAALTLTPLMPEHGHGTSPASFAGSPQGEGLYALGPFDLSMPGVWDLTLSTQGGPTDRVTFTFCVEG